MPMVSLLGLASTSSSSAAATSAPVAFPPVDALAWTSSLDMKSEILLPVRVRVGSAVLVFGCFDGEAVAAVVAADAVLSSVTALP